MTHTPGPWKCKKVGSLADYDIRDEKNYPLAWVEHSQIHDTEANARLIAAAPEMLKALEAVSHSARATKFVDGDGTDPPFVISERVLGKVKQALAQVKEE